MAIPCGINTLNQQSFVECPDGSGLPARAVKICNPEDINPGPIGTQQHVNGIVVSKTVPVDVLPISGKIKAFIIQNPTGGPNRNGSNKVLLVSLDEGVTFFSVVNGGSYSAEQIDIDKIVIDSTRNNTKFEIILEYI